MQERYRGMTLLGTLLKKVKGCQLVLKGVKVPKLMQLVYDEYARRVGYVSNVFGPVSSFLVAVKTDCKVGYPEGSKFYTME